MARADDPGQLASMALLEEPTRRRLYDHVARQARPVTREEAARAVAIDRSLAAYHLDALVDAGLLVASFGRPAGRRGGPGAGRPAKHYECSAAEFAVTVPPRDYELAAQVLVRAAERDPGRFAAVVETVAHARGRELALAEETGGLHDLLEARGFAPYVDEQDVLRLANCPFQRLAREHPETVCGMNLALLRGLLAAADVTDRRARLEPRPDRCCVAFPRIRGG